jgi:hypothetical protein
MLPINEVIEKLKSMWIIYSLDTNYYEEEEVLDSAIAYLERYNKEAAQDIPSGIS